MAEYSVALHQIISELHLEVVCGPEDYEDILIKSRAVTRPALPLTGFYEYFDGDEVQVIGKAEDYYLQSLTQAQRQESLDKLLSYHIPLLVLANGIEVMPEYVEMAKKHGVTLTWTKERTSSFVSALSASLNVHLGERCTIHGVLVEVYGEGVLLLGESGVGKSETAIELIKRGHRLVADDAVEIRKVSDKTLVGSSPANIRHFMELRGVGIINARRIFGMGSVKMTEKVDMVISLEQWDKTKVYDRMGMTNEYMEIMGIKVPSLTIPVKTGRNLAVIIEVAAMNNRQKKMGYNAAQELLRQLGMTEDLPPETVKKDDDDLY